MGKTGRQGKGPSSGNQIRGEDETLCVFFPKSRIARNSVVRIFSPVAECKVLSAMAISDGINGANFPAPSQLSWF